MPRFLTLRAVAEQLGVSERTIYRYMEQHLLHPFKIGKSWQFEQSDIDNLVQIAREKAECFYRNDEEGLKRAHEAMAKTIEDAVVRTFEDAVIRGISEEVSEQAEVDR